MSCCGEKRKKLFRNNSSGRENNKNDRVLSESPKSGKTFIYTGNAPLTIKGISGQIYHFRFKGNKLNVSPPDQPGFMAERDLKIF
jgi:hypothetical protein